MDERHDAEALEADAEDLEHRSERLGHAIERTGSDWRSKQADASVPGAVEPPDAAHGDDDEQPAS